MRRLTFFLAAAMLGFAGGAQASPCPTSNVIQDPPAFHWQYNAALDYWSGTLEIGEATLTVGADTLTTRAYRQAGGSFSIPGPTMKMTPGQRYVLTFKNLLEYAPPSPAENDFKDPNITNIHTHGLHVSGETPGDDVTRLINGGQCGDYVYDIEADHMGGTFWYHAHHHGSTWLQVAGGAFGLLLIDDSLDGIPQNVADMTERPLAIAYLDPDVAGTGGDTLVSGTLSPTWTVNGLVQGNLCTPPSEWQHWRVLLADADARMKTLEVGPECEVALMTRDGVWRTEAPKPLPTNAIELTGASRADLAVRCSADSTISVDGKPVASVIVDGNLPPNSNPDAGPYDVGGTIWSALRPSYLRDLRNEAGPINSLTVSLGARSIGGDKFDKDVPTFTVPAGDIQEWLIKGANNHPFHQHVYHVQPNGACGAFEDGEYYDTLAAGNCLVRFDLNPATASVYEGRTIMHCHILAHEDQGAMGWTDVLGGTPPPAFPDPTIQQALYQCAGTPPPPDHCAQILDRRICKDEPTCDWNNKNKACEPL